jgi:hypothetical protein
MRKSKLKNSAKNTDRRIAVLGMAAVTIARLYRSSGRAYSATQSPALAGQALFLTDDDSDAVTAYPSRATTTPPR